jgi:CRP/FNR family transcriptional regulator, cyclic AMP receptor protein
MDHHPNEVGRTGIRGERPALDARERMLQALLRSEVFAGFDRLQLLELAENSVLQRVPRRRRLYAQGEVVAGLYVVMAGRVRVVRGAGEVRALTVAYRAVGEVIGEIAVTRRATHEDTATATDPVEVVQIPLRHMEELLARHAELARRLLQLMVERRLDTERRIEGLLSQTVESRVAEFLTDAAQRYGIPESRGLLISIKYTHQEIADYVGSTRETVTLTLGELRRRDLLIFDHRRIVVRDLEALARTVQERA